MPICHAAFLKLKSGASQSDIDDFINTFNQFPKCIPGISRWTLGKVHPYYAVATDEWDYAVVMEWGSVKDLEPYMDHPIHKEVGPKLEKVVEKFLVIDYDFDQVVNSYDTWWESITIKRDRGVIETPKFDLQEG
jgi:hypothetical protein